ncbi:hypothetical protein [Anaerococcus degeneri]|uniref:Uncharacterized protein n=1 Tax=Anaerococcus degeneri TaxID=361500 RepID=A0ABS7YXI9_9FIRM|nr:hypothetical protein [Anaerococcus degeneri]MBP2016118.1 hypothetical protein [Anaerococcus degeneri]MCA2096445.1 hypothetical protein [Anaerococcus degeneri]
MFKKLVIGLVFFVIAFFVFIRFAFLPTPEFLRNQEVDGVKIEVQISDDDRNPIIRTYTREEFDTFDQAKIENINDDVDGRVEGDVPCIHLLEDNKIYLTFYKDGKKIEPDDAHIKITAHASDYRDPTKKRYIEGELTDEGDKTYSYATKRYGVQYEKFFIEYLRIEVTYTIEGKDYTSIFATNQDNAPDGTDFFKNEDLKEPLDPEE